MPSVLMTLTLAGRSTHTPGKIDAVKLRGIEMSDRDALAAAYLAANSPGVAAASLRDARQEMDSTLDGEFGTLRTDLTRVAEVQGLPIGAMLVVEESIWDSELDGPFIIDLFVHPEAK